MTALIAAYLLTQIVLGFVWHRSIRNVNARANLARNAHLAICADLLEVRGDLAERTEERDKARLTVAALAEELSRERRGAMILRTGLLEAQREADALREWAS